MPTLSHKPRKDGAPTVEIMSATNNEEKRWATRPKTRSRLPAFPTLCTHRKGWATRLSIADTNCETGCPTLRALCEGIFPTLCTNRKGWATRGWPGLSIADTNCETGCPTLRALCEGWDRCGWQRRFSLSRKSHCSNSIVPALAQNARAGHPLMFCADDFKGRAARREIFY